MSVIKTIELFIKNNFSKTEKETKDLNEELGKTAKAQDEVNKSFDAGATFADRYGKELEPLTTRLGEAEDRLYELALAGDTTSKEYQELLEKVGQYRKVQIETDLAVDGAATTMTQKLGSALTGVTSGFATTQGALALFGSENEALEKSLLKVQAALAIQQGIDGLRTSYKELGGVTGIATSAQKAFNLVLKANPIVLIVSGIAAAVAALASFTDVLDPVIDGLKSFSDFIGLTNFEEDKQNAERRKRAEEERQRIEAERKQREQAFNQRQSEFDREISLLQAEGKSTFELTQQKIQASIAYQKEKIKEIQLELEGLEILQSKLPPALLKASGAQEELNKRKEQVIELNKSIGDSETELKVNVINNNKEKAASYKQYSDERRNIARQIEDLENDLLQEGLEKELEINRDKFRRLREDAKGNAEEQARLRELYTEQELRAEKEIRDKYDVFKTESFAFEIERLEVQAATEIKINDDKNQAIVDSDAEAAKKQQEIRERNKQFAIQTTLDGLNLISDITELFGKKGEKQAKKAFQVQKAAQIATATIETYLSAQKAYTSQLIPGDPTSPVRAGIAAGVAVAAGLANVAKIASQKFEGGGATGGGSDFSDGGVGGGEVAPQFNVVGDAGINQLAQLQQTPTQAFVVSGEVTSAQALDRNRVTNATL